MKKTASNYNLPLVDNRAMFNELIQKDGRAKYLSDDEHPTPLGHQIIANNVWQMLKRVFQNEKAN